ncbi:hypothetical protein AB0A70_06785 [Streptomyces morookaense]|uniref:hypothetical protein n=1 Tax=Streptomyces morookaense TaxID=1970 RepID=UPI0033E6F82B
MKFRIKAGAEVDFLTKDELDSVLKDRLDEIGSGVRYKRIPYAGTSLPISIAAPESGFLWSVKLLSVTFNTADKCKVYVDQLEDSSLVGYDAASDTTHVISWGSNGLILFGTQTLIVSGVSTAASATGLLYVEQVPVGDEWKL